MRCKSALGVVVATLLFVGLTINSRGQDVGLAPGQAPKRAGTLVRPHSSLRQPGDAGVRAHTNIELMMLAPGNPSETPPFAGLAFETPASLACVYKLVPTTPGCVPDLTVTNPSGGSQSIALVDAFDDPNAQSDLYNFSVQFGIPLAPNQLQVVYAAGKAPPLDPTGGWELEESLDIEYAHAMAPNAKIYLVEAASDSLADLMHAVDIAATVIQCAAPHACAIARPGEVSMSWGFEEFPEQLTLDARFVRRNVVFLSSSGDFPGTSWPCTSPNVVCAGGTTTARSPYDGHLLYELTWGEAGGGLSFFEPRPTFQNSLASKVGDSRGVPDLSFDSNPDTGVWILDTNDYQGSPLPNGGWAIVGGTSVASPSLAGIINAAATLRSSFAASSQAENTLIYSNRTLPADIHDITLGYCGPYSGFKAARLWDPCTGVGSPAGYDGK